MRFGPFSRRAQKFQTDSKLSVLQALTIFCFVWEGIAFGRGMEMGNGLCSEEIEEERRALEGQPYKREDR